MWGDIGGARGEPQADPAGLLGPAPLREAPPHGRSPCAGVTSPRPPPPRGGPRAVSPRLCNGGGGRGRPAQWSRRAPGTAVHWLGTGGRCRRGGGVAWDRMERAPRCPPGGAAQRRLPRIAMQGGVVRAPPPGQSAREGGTSQRERGGGTSRGAATNGNGAGRGPRGGTCGRARVRVGSPRAGRDRHRDRGQRDRDTGTAGPARGQRPRHGDTATATGLPAQGH